jgi:CRISPR-associated protein Csb2
MLCLTVTWLSDRYHGLEWPPAPLRVYQALVAGGAAAGGLSDAQGAALRYLDDLPPPRIVAPPTHPLAPATTAVPNNDADVAMGVHAKGKPAQAHKQASKLVTFRPRQPRAVSGPVTYVWLEAEDADRHRDALAALAESVSAVGQGIDLAVAHIYLGEPHTNPSDHVYTPDPEHPRRRRVPYPGALAAIDEVFTGRRQNVRGGAVQTILEPDHRSMGYRVDLDPPTRRHVAFALRRPDDEPCAIDARQCANIAAMTRRVLHQAAEAAGFSHNAIATLMGHGADGGDNRARVLPLPNAGHRYADGFIRRVVITMPPVLSEAEWQALVLRLTGASLAPSPDAEPTAILVAPQADDRLIHRYTEAAQTWTTATPVILPGWDSRNGKRREGKAIRRLLRHAGIPSRLLDHARFEAGPIAEGARPARAYDLPDHLRHLPRTHLTVTWTTEVPGPLCLGAGEGYGLGTLVRI